MKNHLPDEMSLLTQRISIVVVHDLCQPPDESGHSVKADGRYTGVDQVIALDADLGIETERTTLIHEVLHAMFRMVGADSLLSADSAGLEEHIVTVMAPVVLSWLRENPPLIAYLQSREEEA